MNKLSLLLFAILAACVSSPTPKNPTTAVSTQTYVCVPPAPSKALVKLWENNQVSVPESVIYDEKTKSYYVSNVDGGPMDRDGKGYISRLSREGKMIKKHWATGQRVGDPQFPGLNAPKGLRIRDGLLWTSDIDAVVAFDLKSGQVKRRVAIPGAQFLNDVNFDPQAGNVLVSDMLTGRIHEVTQSGWATLAEGPSLENPNGLAVEGESLLVSTWGPGMKEDFTTQSPGQVLIFNLRTRSLKAWSEYRLGNLDGIEVQGPDALLVSDWMAGRVYRITKSGECQLLLEGVDGAADIAWIPKTRTLIVPRMNENKISAYRLP